MMIAPSTPSCTRRPLVLHPVALLVIVLAIGAALRFGRALASPLWFDEIYVLLVARLPLAEVPKLAALDIHPPLTFLLVWIWRALGGEASLWLKSLPLLIGMATLIVTFAAGRGLFGLGTGLLAVTLLAVQVDHVRYSQELEHYCLLAFFPITLVWLGWRWIGRRRAPDAGAFLITATAALYTHYLLPFVLLLLGCWGAVVLRRDRGGLLAWGAMFLALGLAFLPQAPNAIAHFVREGAGSFFHWPSAAEVAKVVRRLVLRGGWGAAALVGAALVALARPERRRAALLLLIVAFVPMWAKRALPLIVPRDFLGMAPLACLVLAAGITALPRPAALPLALVAIAAALAITISEPPVDESVQLARAGSMLRERVGPGDLVVHAETHALLYFLYHEPRLGQQRVWVEPAGRVPYFEGGLMIPDSLYLRPAEWAAARGGIKRWWGVRVDRAYVERGRVSRAGATAAAAMDSAAAVRWRTGKVAVWSGP